MTQNYTYVIAEAGVNHNGSLDLSRQLIDVAAEAGADAVKFQTFRADALTTDSAPKAPYQIETTGAGQSQLEMLRALELSESDHDALSAHCRDRNITFLSTAFDEESLAMLVDRYEIGLVKMPSGEITNGPLMLAAARTGLPVVVSTGMSVLAEVEQALGVLAFGMTRPESETPGTDAFANAYASPEGQAALRERATLLHCTSSYPTPPADANLRAMDTLRDAFGLSVGYSDHTRGIAIPVAAVARGAGVIEKHFTLDRTLSGPDHRASLEPRELRAMVRSIREVEQALGSPLKSPTADELAVRRVARRSLVAAAAIEAGAPLTAANVTSRRPGDGLSPMRYWDVLGRAAATDYGPGDHIA